MSVETKERGKKKMKICFDMDGTLTDLYAVDDWLQYLLRGETTPYKIAKPMCHFSTLARYLNKATALGIKVCIISWTAKGGTTEYNKAVECEKIQWLKKHLPSVDFTEFNICEYGTPKSNFKTSENDILFDDNKKVRDEWGEGAKDVTNILQDLKNILLERIVTNE